VKKSLLGRHTAPNTALARGQLQSGDARSRAASSSATIVVVFLLSISPADGNRLRHLRPQSSGGRNAAAQFTDLLLARGRKQWRHEAALGPGQTFALPSFPD